MARVFAIDGIVPVIDPAAFVHPTAVLTGDVIVAAGCYVGPCCSLRGDLGRLVLEPGCNIQDNCTMHGFPGTDTVIEAGRIRGEFAAKVVRIEEDGEIGVHFIEIEPAVYGGLLALARG